MCGGRGSVTSGLAILLASFDGVAAAAGGKSGSSTIRYVYFFYLLDRYPMISVSLYDRRVCSRLEVRILDSDACLHA